MALGGNALITLICNVSPSASNYFQTLSTLRFASRAKVVKLKPDVNEYYDEKEVLELYKNEIKRMQDEIINEEEEDEDEQQKCEDSQNEDFKMKYYIEVLNNKKLRLENEKLQKEIDTAFKIYYNKTNNNNNNNNTNFQNENNFLSPYITQLTSLLNNNNININSYYLSSLNQLSNEYQLNTLQDFYLNKIKDLHNQITSAIGMQQEQQLDVQKHSVQNIQPLQLNVKTFFEMLNNRTLFEHISTIFNSQKAIQVNKAEYERISDLLENTFMRF